MEKRKLTRRVQALVEAGGPLGAVSHLSQFSDHHGHVFDVGAHKGWIARRLLRIFPDCPLHLFEPVPDLTAHLKQHFGETDGVSVVPGALSDETGTAQFNVAHTLETSSLLSATSEDVARVHPEAVRVDATIDVPVDTIDGYCTAHDIDRIACLKLDVQGAELRVLHGAAAMLDAQAIDLIMLEWFAVPQYDGAPVLADTWHYLCSKDYMLYDIFPGSHIRATGQRRFGDAVFMSNRFRRVNLDPVAFAS